MPNNNPYTQATGAYGATSTANVDQRVLEGTILLRAAQKLEDLAKHLEAQEKVSLEEISDVLDYNQKLWQVFVDNMKDPNCLLPLDIRNNVASLALFVFKRTHEIMIDTVPEKFGVLVSINRNIAAGLMKKPAAQPGAPAIPVAQSPALSNDSMA